MGQLRISWAEAEGGLSAELQGWVSPRGSVGSRRKYSGGREEESSYLRTFPMYPILSEPLFPLGGHSPRVRLLSSPAFHRALLGRPGGSRLLFSLPCWEGLCTKSEAELFGDTAPRSEREAGER